MSNQTNLPEKVVFGSQIDEIMIRKFPGIVISGNNPYVELYYISFTETQKIEKETTSFLFFKKKEIVENKIKHIIPLSFKSFDVAKDFAQYLPNMSITGRRLFETFDERSHEKCDILYETYQITTESINSNIYIKFTENCEHKRKINSSKDDLTQYYINDLDKYREPSGEFFEYNKLIVDSFFTEFAFHENSKTMITNTSYKCLSDIKEFEDNNTHKFRLVEN